MSKKRERDINRQRRSPTETVAHLTNDFIEELEIPALPDQIPQRLQEAILQKLKALLFHLKEARKIQYVRPFEVRLIRDAHRIVLTAYELKIPHSEIYYAEFKKLVEDLGYERTDVGYKRKEEETCDD